jgi:uncharacterized protein
VVIIPFEQLEQETLEAVLEEFITREGTDYGMYEYSLTQKREQLLAQLKQGRILLCFDPNTQSCTLLNKEDALQVIGE